MKFRTTDIITLQKFFTTLMNNGRAELVISSKIHTELYFIIAIRVTEYDSSIVIEDYFNNELLLDSVLSNTKLSVRHDGNVFEEFENVVFQTDKSEALQDFIEFLHKKIKRVKNPEKLIILSTYIDNIMNDYPEYLF